MIFHVLRKQFHKLAAMLRSNPMPYRELGFLCLRHEGDRRKAADMWQRSPRLDPAQPDLVSMLNQPRKKPAGGEPGAP